MTVIRLSESAIPKLSLGKDDTIVKETLGLTTCAKADSSSRPPFRTKYVPTNKNLNLIDYERAYLNYHPCKDKRLAISLKLKHQKAVLYDTLKSATYKLYAWL